MNSWCLGVNKGCTIYLKNLIKLFVIENAKSIKKLKANLLELNWH